jgi:hypothetical protein
MNSDLRRYEGWTRIGSVKTVALALLLAAGAAVPAAALDLNGFLPGKGQGAIAISYTTESYDHFYRGERLVATPGFLGEVENQSLALWFNWGFTDDLALVGNVAYVDTDSDGTSRLAEESFQDLELLLEYRFLSRARGSVRHQLLAAAGIRTPLTDYPADLPVDVGDGSTDALFRIVYHLDAGRFYFSQQVGFDVRGEDPPNGFPLYTELGYTTGPVTWTGFFSKLVADGGSDIGDPGFTFSGNREEYERAGVKIFARLKKGFGISALAFTTLDGRNTGEIDGVSIGASYNF